MTMNMFVVVMNVMRILYGLWIWNMAIFQMRQSMNVMWYVLLRRIGYLESKQIKKSLE